MKNKPAPQKLRSSKASSLAAWLFALSLAFLGAAAPLRADTTVAPGSVRSSLSLNGTWQFMPAVGESSQAPVGEWGKIKVPGDWNRKNDANITRHGFGDAWNDLDGAQLAQAWYELSVSIPAEWAGRTILLDVDPVSTDALIFVNGTEAGKINWPGGKLDITKLVPPGQETKLRLKVFAVDDLEEVEIRMGYTTNEKTAAKLDLRGIIDPVTLTTQPTGPHLSEVFARPSTRTKKLHLDLEFAGHYGAEGSRYLAWLRDLYESYDLGVPMTICNPSSDEKNDYSIGWTERSIPTINSGMCVAQVGGFKKAHPELPVLWTEAWMSWYQFWGAPRPSRTTSNLLFYVPPFFVEGGKGINYYMWHGGTNFAREAMFLQVTNYDYDAPLNEFGQTTAKHDALRAFHSLLREHEVFWLENDLPEQQSPAPGIAVRLFRHGCRELVVLANDSYLYQNLPPATITWAGQSYLLPSESMIWLLDGREIWRCEVNNTPESAPDIFTSVITADRIETITESLPVSGSITRARPEDQLHHTHNQSDYCWYLADLTVATPGPGDLTLAGFNDFAQMFINGEYVARSSAHLKEDRGARDRPDYMQSFPLNLPVGAHRLAVLCSALGLVKGDWQAGMLNMTTERKGIWGAVRWNGVALPGPWQLRPFLDGEILDLPGRAGALARWRAFDPASDVGPPLRWFRLTFDAPSGVAPLALDLDGLGKGLVWVNGECLGRHWLIRISEQKDKHLEHGTGLHMDESTSEPSQRYYHLPRECVRPGRNEIIVFEKTGGDPRAVQVCAWSNAKLI